jgi:polysaccharide pyruvyl transferase WcaK-like protein
LPQTYGPYRSLFSKYLASYIILKAKKVFTRDKEGFFYLQSLLKKKYSAITPVFCPDVAFTMDPQSITNPHICPPLPPETKPLIGLNINGLMYNGGYTQNNMFALALDYPLFIYQLITQLLADIKNARILLIPHTFGKDDDVNSDPYASKAILARIEQTAGHLLPRIHLLQSEHNAHELKSLIGSCHYFIGSRMHSCIAALSQGVPAIGVAYSYKFIGVFNSIGLGHAVIDARVCDISSAIKKIEEFIQGSKEEQAKQKSNIASAQEQIYTVFKSLLDEARQKSHNLALP